MEKLMEGAELLYEGEGWKVLKITTPEAAQAYGERTYWDISGDDAEKYFNSYIEDYDLEAIYFLISDTGDKWYYFDYGDDHDRLSYYADKGYSEEWEDGGDECFWDSQNTSYTWIDVVSGALRKIPQEVITKLPRMSTYTISQELADRVDEMEAQIERDGYYIYNPEDTSGMIAVADIQTGFQKVLIPNTVDRIEDFAFQFLYLEEVEFEFEEGTTLRYIGENAFAHCWPLTHIKLPKITEYVSGGAFEESDGMTQIEFDESSTFDTIYPLTFDDCTCLNSVVLPPSIKSIEEYAFLGCSALENIVIPANVDKIARDVFADTGVKTVEVKGTYRPEIFSKECCLKDDAVIKWVDADKEETWKDIKK